jgi:cytochrome c oxidase cbb3-type subunit 3
MVMGLIAMQVFRFDPGPPPAEIASDELLVLGRKLYLERCTTCHGSDGLGNGPLARSLGGPPPGNLTDDEWKHGDLPDQVRRVIAEGVPGTSMTGWANTFEPGEIDALAAYIYYLADRPVPDSLRNTP